MGNKNNTEAVSLTAIGEKLKAAREKRGLTIDQAQRQTHIHSTVLTALETGRSDEVLTPTYVKSFLKKYALYLGIDQNQIVKEYSSLHPDFESPGISLGIENGTAGSRVDFGPFLRFARNLAIAVVCILIAVFLVKAVAKLKKGPPKPAVGKVQAQAAVKQKQPVAARQTQRKPAETAQFPQINIPQNEPITLSMKVKEQVYVSVKRDGVLLFRRLLPKGSTEIFTASDKLNISIAKSRAVELTLNGRPLGPVGTGSVRDLEITRKSIRVK